MDFNTSKIKSLAKRYGLRLVLMFGSQAQGHTDAESDVDIAFVPSRAVDEQQFYEELVHLLKRADIDLVNIYTTHNHLLRFEIFHNGKVLYDAEPGIKSRMEWESYFDYMDFKRYYDMMDELLDKKNCPDDGVRWKTRPC